MKSERVKLITHGVEEEPGVGSGEIPILFFGILAGLIFLALLYMDRYAGGFNNQVYRPYASYDELMKAQPVTDTAGAKGKLVYEASCQICHQPNGLGTAGQFPPLDGSEWVNGPVERLIRIPLIGLSGPIEIKGQQWNAAMPAMGAALSDDDLAALLTYVRKAWSNKSGPVKPEDVKKVRGELSGRADPMTSEELLKVQ